MGMDDDGDQVKKRLAEFWDCNSEQFGRYTRLFLKRNKWVGERLQVLYPSAKGLKIADIGTGAGFMAISFAQLGHEVTATDISEGMLTQARVNAANCNVNVRFVYDDAQCTTLENDCYDLVMIRDAFHCFTDPHQALARLSGLLRPGGYLVISDGNYFLHRHDPDYSRRNEFFRLETGLDEYERMLAMKPEIYS